MIGTFTLAQKAREKARAVRTAGTQQRGHYDPPADSAHYRTYCRWVARTRYYTARENFCHYWRVVLLYAPAYWLRTQAHRLRIPALVALFAIFAGALVTAIALHPTAVLGAVAIWVCAVYILVAVRVAVHLTSKFTDSDFPAWRWLDRKGIAVEVTFALAALPIIIAYTFVIGIIAVIVYGAITLEDDFQVYSKAWKWFTGARLSERKPLCWIRPWFTAPVALYTCSGVYGFWARLLVITGVVAGLVLVVVGAAYLADLAEERKKDRKKAAAQQKQQARIDRENALLRAMAPTITERLFILVHPEWTGDRDKFQSWFARYKKYCLKTLGQEYWRVTLWHHFMYVRKDYERTFGWLYQLEDDCRARLAAVTTVTPTIVATKVRKRRFVRTREVAIAVREILALVWQVGVSLEERALCPFVDLPTPPEQD